MSTGHPALSLKELEQFDPRARQALQMRFLCPLPACEGKPDDTAHRSLAANTKNGLWQCHRCGERGCLREWWPERSHSRGVRTEGNWLRGSSDPLRMQGRAQRGYQHMHAKRINGTDVADETAARLNQLLGGTSALTGTPGETYLGRRAIPSRLANETDTRFHQRWYGLPAVVFLVRDQQGQVVAASGRYLNPDAKPKNRAVGSIKQGIYRTPGAMDAQRVAIVEAPIDALSLHACGIPALALNGTSWPDWLAWSCAFRQVFLATDADAAGDRVAQELGPKLRSLGANVQRLRPEEGYKDWNEWLQRDPDRLRDRLSALTGEFPAWQVPS